MKAAPREPVILIVDPPEPAISELPELASFRERGWQTWRLTEAAAHPPGLFDEHGQLSLRVRSVRSGLGLERACQAAFRSLAPWTAIWFPEAGPCPRVAELDQASAASEEAHVVLAEGSQGMTRFLCLAAPVAMLFHELEWQLSPLAQALCDRAIDAGASVYSLPSPD